MSIEGGAGAEVTMRFSVSDQQVRVETETPAGADLDASPERFVLSEQILGVVTDSYEVTTADGLLTASFTKSAS
jgi:hypothetical protein